jgi:hypothetical protein
MGAEERESEKKAFHERGSFKAAVAVIGLLTGIWALLGAPRPWEVASDLTANPLPLRNTEVILDASAHMGEKFGKATKLDIAAAQVGRYVVADERIGLALRRVGGGCEEESEQLVGFDNGHSDEVRAAADEQQPAGKANLSAAVRAAINDFSGESFHRPGAENQVVIFAGDMDECDELAGQEIRDELESANIHPVFQVFAIKVSKQTKKSLDRMKKQLRGVAQVEIRTADTVQQLYRAVTEEMPGGGSGQVVQGAAEPAPESQAEEGPEEESEGGESEESGEVEEEGEGGEEEVEEEPVEVPEEEPLEAPQEEPSEPESPETPPSEP